MRALASHAGARLVGLALCLSIGAAFVLPPFVTVTLMTERGAVETSTVVAYLCAVAALWAFRDDRVAGRTWLATGAVLLGFTARELDWHRAWTGGRSVLKVSFYLRDAPLQHKAVALTVIALFLGSLLLVVLRGARPWWRRWRARNAAAVSVGVMLASLVLSKIADRSVSIARDVFGLAASIQVVALQLAIEETLELCVPLLVLLALWQYRGERLPRS